MRADLSSRLARVESFLEQAGFERGPWLAVAYAGGIGAWFALRRFELWLAFLALCAAVAVGALALLRAEDRFPWLRQALVACALALAAGMAVVWAKSALVGAAPLDRPMVATLTGTVMAREDQPAQARLRLTVATRDAAPGRATRVRINVPLGNDRPGLREGARVRIKARLMPPSSPMLPGSYDFARAAWFSGLAATGSALGPVELLAPGPDRGLPGLQRRLSTHVRAAVPGPGGGIAAALASGDRGGIPASDEDAMRQSGLSHLLSVSGLHVSAVVAAAYALALALFALWPWLALRVRVPILAAGTAAFAGIGYTLLTGAQVPTVRSCIGAVLVLLALVLGREALSMRMIAVAAVVVLTLWPEALIGPSFQMSFAAVIAIVALHGAGPVRAFTAPREQPWWERAGRTTAMLLLTGVVIELALMPIGLFHFHQAGIYGALANVIAIPLTTFVSMPLIALALLADLAGLGAPLWWLAGLSLDALLGLARLVASQPGTLSLLPAMGLAPILLFAAGGLWLGLWSGRVRLLGLLPAGIGAAWLATLAPPAVLVTGDGRNVGIVVEEGAALVVLREGRSDYVRGTLAELAGIESEPRPIDAWPGARCTREFCTLELNREGRRWRLLLARGRDYVPERALAAACDQADIVIADRRLPGACRPAWLKADRALLAQTGGLAIDLKHERVRTVAQGQGEHGWWRAPEPLAGDDRRRGTGTRTDDAIRSSAISTDTVERPGARNEAPQSVDVTAATPPMR